MPYTYKSTDHAFDSGGIGLLHEYQAYTFWPDPQEALSILVKMAVAGLGQVGHLPLHENLHAVVLHHDPLHHLHAGQVSIQD